MKSLRDYIDIVEGTALLENPWSGKDQEKSIAWSKLSPEDQKFLGTADPTDATILARAPNKGQPAGQSATPAPTAPAATPPAPAAQAGATPDDVAPTAAPANNQFSYDANGEMIPSDSADAQADAAAAQPAQPATQASVRAVDNKIAADQAASRDAMPFGKAFADAKAKGEKEFTWKGKKYAVAMAKPAAKPAQAATPAPAAGNQPGFFRRALASLGGVKLPQTDYAAVKEYKMSESENIELKLDTHLKELDDIRKIAGLNK